MKKTVFFIPVMLLICIFVFSCASNEQKQAADSAKSGSGQTVQDTNGQLLFEQHCVVCHGKDGKAGIMGSADLSTSTLSHEGMVAIITNGKNSMRAFGNEFTPAQIDAMANYIQSLRK